MLRYQSIPTMNNTCAALGYFDGLHRGHCAVINASVMEGCRRLLFTFEPEGSRKPGDSLLLPDERDGMLERMGVECVVAPPFADISAMSPEEFVSGVLKDRLGVRKVACGENYRFGANAAGDSAELARLCRQYGIECCVVPSVMCGGEAVSTSTVRSLLARYDIEKANRMLGYSYGYSLPVRDGQHLGRTIGAPTINQHFPPGFFLPGFGVYASVVNIDGVTHAAVTNIGVRPTVGSPEPLSETYIHGFDGNLYDRVVEVRLVSFLRPERRFPSVDALRSAIAEDARRSLEIFHSIKQEKGDMPLSGRG